MFCKTECFVGWILESDIVGDAGIYRIRVSEVSLFVFQTAFQGRLKTLFHCGQHIHQPLPEHGH